MPSAATARSATRPSIAPAAASIARRINLTPTRPAKPTATPAGLAHAPLGAMRYHVLALISGVAACVGPQQHVTTSEPRSWAEHMESAQQHEQTAHEEQNLSRDYKLRYESEQEGVVADSKRGFRDEPHSW